MVSTEVLTNRTGDIKTPDTVAVHMVIWMQLG